MAPTQGIDSWAKKKGEFQHRAGPLGDHVSDKNGKLAES
jgi:hypothetical protein